MGFRRKSSGTFSGREEHYIQDNGMLFPTERENAQRGCREGWLVYIHGYTDYRGIHKHTYRYVGELGSL